MPKFAANLTMLFTERPFLDRFEAAAKAGFSAVEFLFPYAFETAEIRRRLDVNGLQLVLHNLPAGDWDAGERGIACHPGREAEFRDGVMRAIDVGTALGTPRLNCLVGKAPAGVDAATQRRTLVDNLRFAAAELNKAGLKLLVEPINRFDIPGFWLQRTDDAVALLDEVAAANAYVQYDIYHAQRTEGEIAATLSRLLGAPKVADAPGPPGGRAVPSGGRAGLARIDHIQLADNPGRNEPGTGELNWQFLFRHIDGLGYAGHIGCEYKPLTTTEAGLGWRQRFGQ